MLIFEVDGTGDSSAQKLFVLSKFLLGRSEDTASKKQINLQSFIDAAQNIGVVVSPETLGELISQEPLSNILEPFQPNSGVVRFKGNSEVEAGMPVDQAADTVDRNAKAAMRRGLGK